MHNYYVCYPSVTLSVFVGSITTWMIKATMAKTWVIQARMTRTWVIDETKAKEWMVCARMIMIMRMQARMA